MLPVLTMTADKSLPPKAGSPGAGSRTCVVMKPCTAGNHLTIAVE